MNRRLDKLESIIGYLLFVSIVVIPLAPKWGTISFITIGLMGLYRYYLTREIVSPSIILKLILILFFVRLVGVAWASDKTYGLGIVETALPLLIFPFLFIFIPYRDFQLRAMKMGFILVSVGTILYAFSQLVIYMSTLEISMGAYLKLHLSKPSDFSEHMLNWDFAHYSFLSLIFIYGFVFLLTLESTLKYSIVILIRCLYLMLMLMFMIFTGARSGLILTIVVGITYGFILVSKKVSLRFLIAVLVLSFFCLVSIITYYITGKKYSENDFTRYQYGVVAISAWKERPWFGLGTGSSKAVMRDIDYVKSLGFKDTWQYNDHPAISHPHNQFINEMLQFGVLGSVPLFLLVIFSLFRSTKANQWDFFLFMIVAAVFMLVEAPLNSNKGIVPFTIIATLMGHRLSKHETIYSDLTTGNS